MSPSCQSKENDSFQYLFPCVLLQTSDHLKPCRAVSPCIYFSMGDLSEWESQPGSAVVMLYQDQHPNFTHGLTFHLLNSQSTITWDPCFNSEVESCPFLSLFFVLSVLLHPAWLWAARLAACYFVSSPDDGGLWLMDAVQDISDQQLLIALKSRAAVGA